MSDLGYRIEVSKNKGDKNGRSQNHSQERCYPHCGGRDLGLFPKVEQHLDVRCRECNQTIMSDPLAIIEVSKEWKMKC